MGMGGDGSKIGGTSICAATSMKKAGSMRSIGTGGTDGVGEVGTENRS